MRPWLFLALAIGCHGAAATSQPSCVDAIGDKGNGVQRFTFDSDWNIVELVESRTLGGEMLATTRIAWGADSVVSTRSPGMFAGTYTSKLGAHGELLSTEAGGTLEWNGTFAPATGRPFLEALYTRAFDPALPLDTRDRTVLTRMRPFVFDGTVTRTERSHRDTATYVKGKLMKLVTSKWVTTYEWTDDQLMKATATEEGKAITTYTFEYAKGQLVRSRMQSDDSYYETRFTHDGVRLREIATDVNGKSKLGVRFADCRP